MALRGRITNFYGVEEIEASLVEMMYRNRSRQLSSEPAGK